MSNAGPQARPERVRNHRVDARAIIRRVLVVGAMLAALVPASGSEAFARAASVEPDPPSAPPTVAIASPFHKAASPSSGRVGASPTAAGLDAVPPANDPFVNAVAVVSGSTSTGTNVAATRQTGEQYHAANSGGASVWWKVTPSFAGPYTVDTGSSSFDTLLEVWTGATVGLLTPIASNDDASASSVQSQVFFNVSAGTTYYIAVDGYSLPGTAAPAEGAITLHVAYATSALLPPPNDNFANAFTISMVPDVTSYVTGNTISGTAEAGEPKIAQLDPVRTAWFRFVAPIDGTLTVDTQLSGFDTVLDVSTGSSLATLTVPLGGSSDDVDRPNGILTSKVVGLQVLTGITYFIRVDGYNGVQGVIHLAVLIRANSVFSPPTEPTNVSAVAGNGQATVSWAAPLSTGSSPTITSYVATASPGGATCTWTTGPLTCPVTSLTNGTAYRFTVYASTSDGQGTPSDPTPPVIPLPAGGFISLSPARLLETRVGLSTVDGQFNGIGPVGAQQSLNLTVTGRAGLPVTGVDSVVLNVTVADPTSSGFVTVFPAGSASSNGRCTVPV